MKGMFIVMVLLLVFGCNGRQNGKAGNQQETAVATGDRVEVMYFHGKQRCVTCRSIEQQTQEVLAEHFGDAVKSGKIFYREVDISDKEGEKIADRYEVTWSSLFVNQWKDGQEKRNNMTDFAFEKATGDSDGFKAGLKAKIEELLK